MQIAVSSQISEKGSNLPAELYDCILCSEFQSLDLNACGYYILSLFLLFLV